MSDNHKKTQEEQEALHAACAAARERFGELIRGAREKAGFSLDEAAAATRITPPFIVALEAGAFTQLPGKVFARGFVRALCKTYGVPSDPLLVALEEAHGAKPADGERISVVRDENAHSVRLRGEIERNTRFVEKLKIFSPSHYFRGLPLFGVAVVGLGIVALIYIALANPQRPLPPLASVEVPAVVVPEVVTPPVVNVAPANAAPAVTDSIPSTAVVVTENAPAAPVVAAQVVAAPVVPAPAAALPAVVAKVLDPAPTLSNLANSQLLEIIVREPVRVKMVRDDGTWVTEELKADSYQLRFKKNAQLLIYDAAALDVSFNGKPLGPLGSKGRFRKLSFKSAGVAQDQSKM